MSINVIDSLMGSGKTTWAITYMKSHPKENFLYITPFLSECSRITESTAPEIQMYEPENKNTSKLTNIHNLIYDQQNISSTHALFKHFTEETKEALLLNDYTLILDEVLDVVDPVTINKTDLKILFASGAIKTDEKNLVHWELDTDTYNGKYKDIKLLTDSNSLIYINNQFLLWRYDPEIFKYFKQIYIMTYLFDASIIKHYFDFYNIPYTKLSIRDNNLVPYYKPDVSQYKNLIHIYEGKLNNICKQNTFTFSKQWYINKENKRHINQLKNNVYNYYRNILSAKADTILWSSFKDNITDIANKKYKNKWLAFQSRATNKYAETSNLVYTVNIFLNPGIIHFFNQKDIHINQNLYALSFLIQWIWRSRIRNNEPIDIYIPSNRMRELLTKWLNNEDIPIRY